MAERLAREQGIEMPVKAAGIQMRSADEQPVNVGSDAYRLVDGYQEQGPVVRYTLVSDGWGQDCTGEWTRNHGFSNAELGEIASAVAKWEAACGVDLQQVPYWDGIDVGPHGQVDIIIGMKEWDGYGNVVGITFVGEGLVEAADLVNRECGPGYAQVDGNDALVVIDSTDFYGTWYSGAKLASFHNTVLHELGHALGIDHSNHTWQVMSGNNGEPGGTPYITDVGYRLDLRSDDVAAAQRLYGPPRKSLAEWSEGQARLAADYETPASEAPARNKVDGTSGADTLNGSYGSDDIRGGSGNDRIWAYTGDDIVLGGAGDDQMFGMEDDDIHYGNEGNDIVLGGVGDDWIAGDQGELRWVESGEPGPTGWWTGLDGDDRVWAEAGDDWVQGDGGDDFLSGGEGNDVLAGGSGQDYLDGGSGDDELHGNGNAALRLAGNIPQGWEIGFDAVHGGDGGTDVLAGGEGNDTLYGSSDGGAMFGHAGADTFVFGGGVLWLMDWQPGIDRVAGLDGPTGEATAVGEHVRLDLSGETSGQIFIANSTLGEIDGIWA